MPERPTSVPEADAIRDRRTRALRFVLLLAGFLVISGLAAMLVARGEERPPAPVPEAFGEVREKGRDFARRALQEIEERGAARSDPAAARDFLASMDEAAEAVTGLNRIAMDFNADILRRVLEASRPLEDLAAELKELGGVDPATIQHQDQIRERIAIIDQWNSGLGPIIDLLRNAESQFIERVRDEAPGADAERVARDFLSKMNVESNLEIRSLDRKILADMRDILVFLDERCVSWEYDPDQRMILFEQDQDIETYNALIDRMLAHVEAKRQIQQRMLQQLIE